jgi:hypothetical protein
MTDRLTASESAILIILMAYAREVSSPELKERFQIEIRKDNRDKLNSLGYVASRKPGRFYVHELTDKGWARLHDDLNFENPRARIMGAALAIFQTSLRDRLPRFGIETFGELFSQTAVVPAQRAEPAADTGDLGERIRGVYASLAGGAGAWVSLASLRQHFTDVPRAELDEALKRLSREDGVHLAPEDNQKTLTAAEIDAAVRSGGQDKHLLAIGV